MLLGAIEAGGTKMICAIGDETGRITDRISIPTETPEKTMPAILEYFRKFPICAMGIACFGPIDLNRNSKTYGFITSTTKVAWRNYDFLGTVQRELKVPCGFDTDVNGAALGEATYGCMKGLENGLYITVGTGVGVGVLCNGALVHGMLHPEGGHVLLKRHPDDSCEGICVYHGDCLEGLASGPAIEKRAGRKAQELDEHDHEWEIESYYLAQGICDYIMILSPEKIVMGGGVMNQPHLMPMVREKVKKLLAGYICTSQTDNIDSYIVPTSLGGDQAVMGCMKLAYDAACNS